MLSEFVGKWGMECLNTSFPLPTAVCGIQRKADLELLQVHRMCHLSYTTISYFYSTKTAKSRIKTSKMYIIYKHNNLARVISTIVDLNIKQEAYLYLFHRSSILILLIYYCDSALSGRTNVSY